MDPDGILYNINTAVLMLYRNNNVNRDVNFAYFKNRHKVLCCLLNFFY